MKKFWKCMAVAGIATALVGAACFIKKFCLQIKSQAKNERNTQV